MTAGSSMLAITLSLPPQRAHASMSMPNTRFSRWAQHGLRSRLVVLTHKKQRGNLDFSEAVNPVVVAQRTGGHEF